MVRRPLTQEALDSLWRAHQLLLRWGLEALAEQERAGQLAQEQPAPAGEVAS